MKVTEKGRGTPMKTSIQTNDIPNDTAFRGTVHYEDGSKCGPGIWIKVSHGNNEVITTQGQFVVVGLTALTGRGNLFPFTARCLRVLDYVPINELSIEVIS